MTDRMPPSDRNAERAVLGSMCLQREIIADVMPILPPERVDWFYDPRHAALARMLYDLYNEGEAIDVVTCEARVRRDGIEQQTGGMAYLLELVESIPSAANATRYARIVRGHGMLRDLIRAAGNAIDLAYDAGDDAEAILGRAESMISDVTERRVSSRAVSAATVSDEVMRSYRAGKRAGIPSGFHGLDKLTAGLQPAELIIVAARPSMGKTAIGLNMAVFGAAQRSVPTAFFSMEMSSAAIAQRMLCGLARVDAHKFRERICDADEVARLEEARADMPNIPLYVDDTATQTVMSLRASLRAMTRRYGIKAAYIDYLQLMSIPKSESRRVEVDKIATGLKGIAVDMRIPIVAMAQLNRQTETRTDTEPRMSDLRESGAIEQAADVICLLHREEYYDRGNEALRGKAKLIVAKQRNGPTGDVKLAFDHATMTFMDEDLNGPVYERMADATPDREVVPW